MSFNKESGIRTVIARYHLMWVSFYLIFFLAIGVLVVRIFAINSGDALPSGHIELSVNKKKYQVGEEIYFTVTNRFPATVYIKNNCPEEPLEAFKWVNKKWIAIHDQVTTKSSLCYTQPRNISVPANGTLSYSYSDWKNLFAKPGVYRIVMVIDHYQDLPFQDFVVMKPQPAPPPYTAPLIQYQVPQSSTPQQLFGDDD